MASNENPTKGFVMNEKLKKNLERAKKFYNDYETPIVCVAGIAAGAAATVAHYEKKTLLELTPKQAKRMIAENGGLLYKTKLGDFVLFSKDTIFKK
jgi:hypothetical protein